MKFVIAILLAAVSSALPQGFDDRAFLTRATDRVAEYAQIFNDLTATETATFRIRDDSGKEHLRRTVDSSLIVYRSQADANMAVEYRDVISVDGKEVKDRSKRAIKLLEGVTDSKSAIDELQRITKEGSRYNEDFVTINLTLHEAIPLMMKCRHAFTFAYIGDETVRGIPTRVYYYEQVQPCDVSHYTLHLPDDYEKGEKWHQGRLWLETSTARLVREQRTVFASHVRNSALRAKIIDVLFDYTPSTSGILVPSEIDITSYVFTGRSTPDGPVTEPRTLVTQSYGPFSRFEVSVEQRVVGPDSKQP